MGYAGIITENTNTNVDRLFTYKIPDDMEIKEGMCVKIPFGKGNKIIRGYVAEIYDTVNIEDEKLKYIVDTESGEEVISQKRMSLALWMKNKYYCSLSSCVQCMLPKKVNEKLDYRLSLGENTGIKLKGEKQKQILSEMEGKEFVLLSTLKEKYGNVSQTVESLVKRGILIKEDVRKYRGNIKDIVKKTPPVPTEQQREVLSVIEKAIDEKDIKPILIRGVTGSGKTEVYLRTIEKIISLGKQAVMLVPEISLTHQTVERFTSRFGERVAVTHSGLSSGERYDQWCRAKKGEIDVMIGPRSALFTPFENLGAVIVDEEHEHTYRSELTPKYDAGEVAEKLGEIYGSITVLGSATPSVSTYYKALEGEYKLTLLTNRVNNTYPDVEIVDMRKELKAGNFSVFSSKLRDLTQETLSKGKQAIFFLNRRGYSSFVSCRSCGFVLRCDRCDVNYTYHLKSGTLSCHYCGRNTAVPTLCPVCGSKYIKYFGIGTEKLAEETLKNFPGCRVLRMDTDTTSVKGGHKKILDAFAKKEADILIGTQMISKGLDFPDVSLVGIVAADMSLNGGDYKASENTFQLVNQVAGRAGRAEDKGNVVIQTYSPDNYSIACAAKNDYTAFYEQEILFRKQMGYLPFVNVFRVLFEGKDQSETIRQIRRFHGILLHYNKKGKFSLYGPNPCNIEKLNNKYRWQIIVKYSLEENLRNYVLYCLEKYKEEGNASTCNISLYMNPNNMI